MTIPSFGSRAIKSIPTPIVLAENKTVIELTEEDPAAGPERLDAKVLHVVNGEHFSGAERVQSHLGRCLPEFGVTVDFACVKPGKFSEMLVEQKGAWGRGHDTPMSNRFDLTAAWRLRDLIRNHQYDLLHAHTPRTAMLASLASRLTRIPWVYHVHSPAGRDSAKQFSNRINAWVERTSLLNCSHLISVSESLRLDCIRCGHSEEDVSVVHNGVPGIRPQRIATPQVGGRWVLGMVALQRPRKGLEIVLDALAKIAEQDITLRVIGPFETEEYEQEINTRIDELGIADRVERVGFTKDVPAELAKIDALVLPSLFGEGLPMVVLESMAAGLPVIATRVEGTPEAVTDGVEGLLAEPSDVESLRAKILQLVTGDCDWHQMAEAAFQRHARDFSDIAMAKRTMQVYRKLLCEPDSNT